MTGARRFAAPRVFPHNRSRNVQSQCPTAEDYVIDGPEDSERDLMSSHRDTQAVSAPGCRTLRAIRCARRGSPCGRELRFTLLRPSDARARRYGASARDLTAIETLKRGGCAADAAIAAAACLGFLEPTGSGLGGDCYVLLWDPGDRKLKVACWIRPITRRTRSEPRDRARALDA